MIVTKEQYRLIDQVLFQPEEDIALHAESRFDEAILSSKSAKPVMFSKFFSCM